MDSLRLDGAPIDIGAVVSVARQRRQVALTPAADARMAAARQVVLQHLEDGRPVYGLTTGLGPRATSMLPADILSEFSRVTVRGRAHGVGARLPAEAVRAAMLIRAQGLAQGSAGADPAIAGQLVALLNAGIHPVVPSIGSIGAADLVLMGHIGLVMMGEGEAELDGTVISGAAALERAGLKPVAIGPKDGIAIVSSNAITVGRAALALHDARRLFDQAILAAALSMEGFRGNLSPFDPRIAALRPSPGQASVSARLLRFLDGGSLTEPGAARRVQDPLSLRCIGQVLGSLESALDFAESAVEPELSGSGDNPSVILADGVILSNGNFHVPAIALAFDTAAIGLAQSANLAVQRTAKLLTDRLSDLPPTLSPRGTTRAGMAPLLKTGEALAIEISHLANPVSTLSRSSADGVEDDTSNAPQAVAKLETALDRFRLLVALELVVAAQAVEFANPERLGRGTTIAQALVRAVAPRMDEDRGLGGDVDAVAAMLMAPDIDLRLAEILAPR
ncbi:MAG: aromatic amino acid ammonia-lyase [Rhodospirillaceae bacterium]|nr:aromatic amino acid ammonia-lyase [Rhodospirillaceae bacterium]